MVNPSIYGQKQNSACYFFIKVCGFLRYLVSIAHLQDVFYLWRPFSRDPNDDMVLECAFASGIRYLVTHNLRDFNDIERLGVIPTTPSAFMSMPGSRL